MKMITRNIRRLEKKIDNQLGLLKKGFINKDDEDLAFKFNLLKEYDEASYEKHFKMYTNIIKKYL